LGYQTFPNRKTAAGAAGAMLGWERPRPVLLYLPDDPHASARGNAWVLAVGPTRSPRYLRSDGFVR
jgi:hypothetical protein